MNAQTERAPRSYPHRNAAIRAGRLRGQRSQATRAKYRTLIEAIARRGAGPVLLPPICESAVGKLLEAMGESELHERLVDFCRRQRNHIWVRETIEGNAP